jgi:transcription termination factor NusA
VRLASKLTGWNIDITTQSRIEEKEKAEAQASTEAGATPAPPSAPAAPSAAAPEVGAELKEFGIPEQALAKLGIKTQADLAKVNVDELAAVEGVGPEKAKELVGKAKEKVAEGAKE